MRREPTPAEEILLHSILDAAYELSNTLGCGFLEKVYQRGLVHELSLRGIETRSEVRHSIYYKNVLLGNYISDLIVDSRIIVEVKCVERFTNAHTAQAINYLKATALELALLINFQNPRVEHRRIIRTI